MPYTGRPTALFVQDFQGGMVRYDAVQRWTIRAEDTTALNLNSRESSAVTSVTINAVLAHGESVPVMEQDVPGHGHDDTLRRSAQRALLQLDEYAGPSRQAPVLAVLTLTDDTVQVSLED